MIDLTSLFHTGHTTIKHKRGVHISTGQHHLVKVYECPPDEFDFYSQTEIFEHPETGVEYEALTGVLTPRTSGSIVYDKRVAMEMRKEGSDEIRFYRVFNP